MAGSALSCIVMTSSAPVGGSGITMVSAVARLLLRSRSVSLLVTVAVLVSRGSTRMEVITILTVAWALRARGPGRLQVTILPALVQIPCGEVAAIKMTPLGRVSVTTILLAGLGPLLVTVSS